MQENLVIVESPAKAKTIEKFLGQDFKVMSSYGHIRDLKKKEISINMDNLNPDYEIPEEKRKLVADLKAKAKKARQNSTRRTKVSGTKTKGSSSSPSNGAARVSVRRERH